MNNLLKINFRKRKRLTSVLGLTLDGSRLHGVVLRRVNGSVQIQQHFSAVLTLDLLTAAPELAGREIRNHLDAANVRERHCIFGVPLKWVLTAQTELPALPEADATSLLAIEAERGFPTDVTALVLGDSRCALAADKKHVLFAGIPRAHIATLERVLAAARLKPLSFALGLTALQPPGTENAGGVLALAVGEGAVSLQITCGGVAALRAIDGAMINPNGLPAILPDLVAREARITIGQLPADLRSAVKQIRIFGPRELTQTLADEMKNRFGPMGMAVEIVTAYAANELGLKLPPETAVSAAFSLAARRLVEQKPAFEFLPPKPTLIEQFAAKYSSGRLRTAGAGAGAIAVLVGGLFFIQQIQLWRLQSQWSAMSAKVMNLQAVQDQIRRYRPWFDDSFRDLAVLRQLSLAFPEDGSVTAKAIEIHDDDTVSCSGTARDNAALLAMQARLRTADGVSGLKLDLIHGKAPLQFTFDFHYTSGGPNEN